MFVKNGWWFAWFPVEVEEGKIIWLKKVWRSLHTIYLPRRNNGFLTGHVGKYDYWRYYLKETENVCKE